jgi:hypothetical protein
VAQVVKHLPSKSEALSSNYRDRGTERQREWDWSGMVPCKKERQRSWEPRDSKWVYFMSVKPYRKILQIYTKLQLLCAGCHRHECPVGQDPVSQESLEPRTSHMLGKRATTEPPQPSGLLLVVWDRVLLTLPWLASNSRSSYLHLLSSRWREPPCLTQEIKS